MQWFEIEVVGEEAHILTVVEDNGIERVIKNDTIPAEYANTVGDLLSARVTHRPYPMMAGLLYNDGSPRKWANGGIG